MSVRAPGDVWAVVLAAGEGSRMAPLTRLLYGRELPKQFAALDGDQTLLQGTMDRIAPIAPAERTVVVVSEEHHGLARDQLAGYPGVEIVPQPANLGTGNGILLPLAHVMARDPQASVAIFPSDHHVRRRDPFVEAVRRAVRVSSEAESGVALLGAAAERPAVDLGWIVRGGRLGDHTDRAWRVHEFVEKPPEPVAMRLLGSGSLWNTMVVAGRAQAVWQLARRHLPRQALTFERYLRQLGAAGGGQLRRRMYEQLLPADFSRDVLQTARGLAVVPVIDSGWFDCGTPERLIEWLRETPEMAGMLTRLERAVARANGSRPRPGRPSVIAAA